MGKQVSTIQFTGKLGNLVGAKGAKGNVIIRPYVIPDNPNTTKQVKVRTSFLTATGLAAAFGKVIIGLSSVAKSLGISRRNLFVKKNYGRITATTSMQDGKTVVNTTVDYPNLILSQGSLPPIQFGSPSTEDPLEITVPLADSAAAAGASIDDLAYLIAYNPVKNEALISQPKKRGDEDITLLVPDYWVGDQCHVYGFGQGIADAADRVAYESYWSGDDVLAEAEIAAIESGALYSKTSYLGAATIS